MIRRMAAILAAIVVLGAPAAGATGSAPAVRSVTPDDRPSRWAGNVCLVAGLAMIAASFEISEQANDRYDDYLAATEPEAISNHYDRTVSLDRWASGTLIGGEALVATGLYLRFLRRPATTRVAWSLRPDRCAVSYRF